MTIEIEIHVNCIYFCADESIVGGAVCLNYRAVSHIEMHSVDRNMASGPISQKFKLSMFELMRFECGIKLLPFFLKTTSRMAEVIFWKLSVLYWFFALPHATMSHVYDYYWLVALPTVLSFSCTRSCHYFTMAFFIVLSQTRNICFVKPLLFFTVVNQQIFLYTFFIGSTSNSKSTKAENVVGSICKWMPVLKVVQHQVNFAKANKFDDQWLNLMKSSADTYRVVVLKCRDM